MPDLSRRRQHLALLSGLLLWSATAANAFPEQWLQRWVIPLHGLWEMSTDGGQTWSAVTLPHSASGGTLRYRRTIRMDSAALRRQWHLATFGMGDIADIFLNGRHAAQLVSYGLPTTVALPTALWHAGDNVLELRLSAEPLKTSFLGPQRPRGCFRELLLLGTASAWLQHLETRAETEVGIGRVGVAVTVAGSPPTAEPLQVRIRLLRPADSTTVAERTLPLRRLPQRITASVEVPNPTLWSPHTPVLYALLIELLAGTTPIDGARTAVGFRSLGIRQQDTTTVVICNGQQLPLYGVEYYTAASPALQTSAELDLLRAAGITVVRLRGVPPHPEWLWACARAGIALIAELPITEVPPPLLWQPTTRFLLEHYLRLLTPLLGNPAVIGLILWHGLPEHPAVRAYEQAMQQRLRAYNLLLGAELYGGTHGGQPPRLPLLFVRLHPPFVDSHALEAELSRWAELQRAGSAFIPIGGLAINPQSAPGYLVPHSAEAQAHWIWRFLTLCKASVTAGALLWSWRDYVTAFPLVSFPFPMGSLCRTGLIDTVGVPRPAYATLQAFLQGDLEPIVAPGQAPWGTLPLYVLWATGLLLLSGWVLNRSPRLRHLFWRALSRSSSLFADLRDGRFTDGGTTLVYLALSSLSIAAFGSLLQEWLRMRPPWVIVLWQLLPAESLREAVGWLLPRRWAQLLVNTLVWPLALSVLAFLTGLAARVFRRRLPWRTAMLLLVWGTMPLSLPLPLLLLGERLLQTTVLQLITVSMLGVVTAWSVWRTLWGLHIVLRLRLWAILFGVFWGMLLLGGIGLGLYELSGSLSAYVSYVTSLWEALP